MPYLTPQEQKVLIVVVALLIESELPKMRQLALTDGGGWRQKRNLS